MQRSNDEISIDLQENEEPVENKKEIFIEQKKTLNE